MLTWPSIQNGTFVRVPHSITDELSIVRRKRDRCQKKGCVTINKRRRKGIQGRNIFVMGHNLSDKP